MAFEASLLHLVRLHVHTQQHDGLPNPCQHKLLSRRVCTAPRLSNVLGKRTVLCDTGCPHLENIKHTRSQNHKDNEYVYNYWKYDAGDGAPMTIRRSPAIDSEAAFGDVSLEPGEYIAVDQEIVGHRQGEDVCFLKLADGRGWVFDRKPGVGQMCHRDLQLEGRARLPSEGVDAFLNNQRVHILNGRLSNTRHSQSCALPGWTLDRNGFCLLTNQPLQLSEDAFDAVPTAQNQHVFRVYDPDGSSQASVVRLPVGTHSPSTDSLLEGYYRDIALAAKNAFPDAEFVLVPGHFVISADSSMLGYVALRFQTMCAQFLPESMLKHVKASRLGAVSMLHADLSREAGANAVETSLRNSSAPYLNDTSKTRRVVTANFWRNIQAQPIKNNHLAVMDAQTLTEHELLEAHWRNPALGGRAQYHMPSVRSKQQLVYFPDMTSSEVLVFKQGEYNVSVSEGSDSFRVAPASCSHMHHILHTSFRDPHAPLDLKARKSVVCHVTVIMKQSDKVS